VKERMAPVIYPSSAREWTAVMSTQNSQRQVRMPVADVLHHGEAQLSVLARIRPCEVVRVHMRLEEYVPLADRVPVRAVTGKHNSEMKPVSVAVPAEIGRRMAVVEVSPISPRCASRPAGRRRDRLLINLALDSQRIVGDRLSVRFGSAAKYGEPDRAALGVGAQPTITAAISAQSRDARRTVGRIRQAKTA
jgi:hypothetical protein